MNLNYFFGLLICISSAISLLYSENSAFSELEALDPTGELRENIETLFIQSGELPPPSDNLSTLADIIKQIKIWTDGHPKLTTNQEQLLNKILTQLNIAEKSSDNYKYSLSSSIGFDFLHKPITSDPEEISEFYSTFKDHEVLTKYEHRGSFLDFQYKVELWDHFLISTKFALRDDWTKLNQRENYYPHSLNELNDDFNRKAFIVFRYDPVTVAFGRDNIHLGIGEHGKLMLSDDLPPLDHFRLGIRLREKFTFQSIIAPIKYVFDENAPPKILALHRLEWKLTKNFRFGITESVVTNRNLRLAYLNPFMVFHNVSGFAARRNILSGFDLEYLISNKTKTYFAMIIDELDVAGLEEIKNKENRQALGCQLGLKFYTPFNIPQSNFHIEWVKLDRWLYNYPYADGTLAFVYEEDRNYPDSVIFNRFMGHYLGSNAEAIFFDFAISNWTFNFQNISQGELLINQPAFSEYEKSKTEYKLIYGIQYQNSFYESKINLKFNLFYSDVNNYHNQLGINKNFVEFWINVSYRIFTK